MNKKTKLNFFLKLRIKTKLKILLFRKQYDKWEYEDICYMFPNEKIKARDLKNMTDEINDIKKAIKKL